MPLIVVICVFIIFPKPYVQGEFHAWCKLTEFGCGEKPNSMCIYDEALFKNQCLNMVDGIAQEAWIRRYWMALINSFRDKVAGGKFDPWPEAANMKQLAWDDTLEAQARRWNFQCFLKHSDDCNRNFEYNQSQIAQIQSHMRDVKRRKFADEVKDLFESVVRQESRIKNVQQLVDKGLSKFMYQNGGPDVLLASLLFANNEKVGASLIVSGWENKNESNIMRSNTYLAPISIDTAVYTRGSPCSQCQQGWSCRKTGSYKNLCAHSSHSSEEQYIEVNCALRIFESAFTVLIFVAMMIFTSAELF